MLRAETYPKTAAALACSLAIAAMAIFGNTEGLSNIPQAISVVAVGLVFVVVLLEDSIPGVHLATLAFLALIAFWGLSLIESPGMWAYYLRLLKLSALSLASHVIFRTPKHLLLLFGAFGATGLVNVALNWGELSSLGAAFSGGERLSDADRFAGTFGNANTAGIYGTTVLLLALIFFFNSRNPLRWLVLLSGVLGGTAVVYFTGSRKSMLALGLTALFLPWMTAQRDEPRKRKWVNWLLLSAITIAFVAVLFSKLPYTERLLVQFREGIHAEASSDQRAEMAAEAVELWRQQPLFGCGFEGFARLSGFDVYSHSTFTEVLCNSGLFGLILIGLFYLIPGLQLVGLTFLRRRDPQGNLYLGLFALWVQLVLFSFFGVMYYSGESLCIYMAICGYLRANRMAKTARILPAPASTPQSALYADASPALQKSSG